MEWSFSHQRWRIRVVTRPLPESRVTFVATVLWGNYSICTLQRDWAYIDAPHSDVTFRNDYF